MNRTTRMLIVLLVAIGLATAASIAVYQAVQRIPVRQVEIAQVQIVVAAGSVPVGTIVSKDNVKLVGWPAGSPVPGSFTSVDAVVGRGTVVTLAENEPFTEAKLAPKEAGGGLPPTIPAGMRALSVKVTEVIGVAGFVLPGTHVDVIATVSHQQDTMTRTVLSDILVLTAGTKYDQDATRREGSKPIPTTVVTLALTPEDAEKLALAQLEGRILLSLRNPMDPLPTKTPGVRLTSLMGPAAPPPVEKTVKGRKVVVAAKPVEPQAAPKPYTVETIRAAKRTEEVVK